MPMRRTTDEKKEVVSMTKNLQNIKRNLILEILSTQAYLHEGLIEQMPYLFLKKSAPHTHWKKSKQRQICQFWPLLNAQIAPGDKAFARGHSWWKRAKKDEGEGWAIFFTRSLLYSSSPTVSLESLRFPLESCVLYKSSRKLTSVRILKGENF